MNLLNWLAVVIQTDGIIKNVVELDWLGEVIQSLIKGCGSIGLGVIVFTLILKLITLPFDIMSRVSTKKNSAMMEKMRPELERLQRQYSNNSELYQRKMQELYKKNGYSPFSACLPTLLNLVVFIVVIGQFSTYSNYANFQIFCDMSIAYEQAVENFCDENPDLIIKGDLIDDNQNVYGVKRTLNLATFISSEHGSSLTAFGFNASDVTINYVNNDESQGIASFTLSLPDESIDSARYQAVLKALSAELAKGKDGVLYEYAEIASPIVVENGIYSIRADYDGDFAEEVGNKLADYYGNKFVNEYIKEFGREAAANEYRANKEDVKFLWVKNIWCQDLPWEHPIKASFASYGFLKKSGCLATCGSGCNNEENKITTVSEAHYAELTANLVEEKSQANGYLILVVLSIGTMFISQIIAQKQAKTQTELGSVDGANGTAAQSQKMMTWMMPIMFGMFSFMYTASFSIYIIVSSAFSLTSNAIINLLVDRKFARIAAEEARKLELRRTGKLINGEESTTKNKKK